MTQPILRVDVHTHPYPPGYLEALVGSGRVTRERDANGTEVLLSGGARLVTLTPPMTGVERRWADMEQGGHPRPGALADRAQRLLRRPRAGP